jgi:hypothetical protein
MNKQVIILFLVTLIIGSVSCDKARKEYKDADAVFDKITKVYTLNKDGSIDYRYKHKLNIRSYYAFNRLYGETFIVYNPDHQKLKINKSVTETSEGKKVPSPDNAFNKVLPRFAEGAPPYSHLREMVVTHTGLEKNSTITLDYLLKSNKNFKPFLMENEVLAKRSPIRKLTIKVRFPEEKKLNYKLLNAKEKLNISEKGDFKEYKWTFNNIEPISHQHKQPENKEHLPRLIFSTNNFDEAYSYYTDQLSSEVPGLINETINKTLEDKESKIDTILAIQDVVVNHINHFNIPAEYTGYKIKSNENVLTNNGGTTIEKTNLLASILNKLDVDAEVVGIIPSEFYKENTGNFKTLQDFYVKVQLNDEILYFSAIHENSFNPKHKYAEEVNVLLNDSYEKPQFIESSENASQLIVKGNLKLTENNHLTGTINHKRTYCENPYYEVAGKEDKIKTLLIPVINPNDIKSHTIETLDNEKLSIIYKIDKKFSLENKGGYSMLRLPMVNSGLVIDELSRLVSKRNTPLEINWPIKISHNYIIKLPENIELRNKSVNIKESSENEKVKIKIDQEKNKIHLLRTFEIKNHLINPGGFSTFNDAIDLWQKPNYRTLVLKTSNQN